MGGASSRVSVGSWTRSTADAASASISPGVSCARHAGCVRISKPSQPTATRGTGRQCGMPGQAAHVKPCKATAARSDCDTGAGPPPSAAPRGRPACQAGGARRGAGRSARLGQVRVDVLHLQAQRGLQLGRRARRLAQLSVRAAQLHPAWRRAGSCLPCHASDLCMMMRTGPHADLMCDAAKLMCMYTLAWYPSNHMRMHSSSCLSTIVHVHSPFLFQQPPKVAHV